MSHAFKRWRPVGNLRGRHDVASAFQGISLHLLTGQLNQNQDKIDRKILCHNTKSIMKVRGSEFVVPTVTNL